MKHLATFLTFVFILSFPGSASAQSTEHVSNYDVDITIQENADVFVEETIAYDFGSQYRHGLYRTIPYRFEMDTAEGRKTFELETDVISVANEYGTPYIYDTTQSSGNISLKIGDPDSTITGEHTYIVTYVFKGALRYFEDHDELYMNAIGTDWTVTINKANVRVSYPYDQNRDEEYQYRCIVGSFGEKDDDCAITPQKGTVEFTTGTLLAGEGVTIVVGMPKGLVSVVYPKEYIPFFNTPLGKVVSALLAFAAAYWYIFLPFTIMYRWFKYGRDPIAGTAPTAYFDPPQTQTGRELTPAETGALVDEYVHRRDVLSIVIDLAKRGHIKIVEKKKNDFYLEKDTRGADDEPINSLPTFEAKLLTDLFDSKKSIRLKDAKLVTTVEKIKEMLYESLVREQFFLKNPETTRTRYAILGFISLFTLNVPLFLVALTFGRAMPRKTMNGATEALKAKGLYSFLKSQEQKINFEGADPQILFERLLPYAVAFGVEKNWMKKFDSVTLREPDWYSSHGAFNQSRMLSGMQSTFKSFNAAATPASSSSGFSSGGGFSGGGVGGGGGGSW